MVKKSLMVGCSLLPILVTDPACAQAQSQSTEQPSGESTTSAEPGADSSGDIVVTARKRDETLIDVPVAVDVVTAQEINRNLATDLSKIGEITPTVIIGAYKSNGGGTIAIRGISSPANQAGFEQAVSVAVDNVQTSDGRIAQLGMFDVAQVEVLKGPQALFFGKNSPAGVISVKTADPTRRLTISGRAGYEFVGDEAIVDGAVSGPLSDKAGYRLAIRYRNLDGWLRNTAGAQPNPFFNNANGTPTGAPAGAASLPGASDRRPGDKELLGRLTLRAEVADRLTARLKLFAAGGEDSGPGVATQNIGPCSGPYPRYGGIADVFADCKIDNRTTIGDVPAAIASTMRGGGDGSAYGKLRAYTAALDLDYDLGFGNLVATSGYNWISYRFFSGLDQTSFSQLAFFNKQRNKAFSQEVRFSSNLDGPFNVVLGGFYQDMQLDDTNDTKINDRTYNATSNRYVTYEDLNHQDGTTLSFFAQGILNIQETVELAGGARWTREKKNFNKRNLYGVGAFNTLATIFPGSSEPGVLRGTFRDTNVSPEVTLTWRPENNRTLYVAYKTGFKSGGFGLTSPMTTGTRIGDVDYGSEKARGVELGAKGLFLANRLRLQATAFAYKFKDLQVNTYDPARIAYTINNAGAVKQRGVELEANLQAAEGLTLHSSVARVRNRFENFIGQCYGFTIPAGTAQSAVTLPPNCSFVSPGTTSLTLQQVFSGRAPARSPEWAGNAGFDYDASLSDSLKFGVSADAFYSGGYFASDTMAPSTRQEAFWRFNASARIAEHSDRWSLSLIGRNLTNEYYLLYAADRTGGTGVPLAIGEQRGVVARGREVAVQAAFRF